MNRWIKYMLLLTLVATMTPKKGCSSKKCNCPHFMADSQKPATDRVVP